MAFEALEKAVEIVGGQCELARRIGNGVKQQNIWLWIQRGWMPPKFVITVERITRGEVGRHRLAPDIYPTDGASESREAIERERVA